MLCTLSKYVNSRLDIGELIYAFLITQAETLVKVTSSLVVLRLMRTISCYSIALYFPYIE